MLFQEKLRSFGFLVSKRLLNYLAFKSYASYVKKILVASCEENNTKHGHRWYSKYLPVVNINSS